MAMAGRALAQSQLPVAQGPFKPTRESLSTYQVPEWFRDAKFGIWAHWGPQSAPEFGDWYARNMYMQGSRQYEYHVQKYGHPSTFGFKDVIPTWKAESWDPNYLMALYKQAGAKYFVSMGVHHDNFDLWNSKYNQWNAVNMGPKRDIVGQFQQAALKEGLRFGVSEHLAVSYHWFQTSHGADKTGPKAGVAYDGADPKYAAYYHETHAVPKDPWEPEGVPAAWKQMYFNRIKDLLDSYQPDLLYTDGPIFFDEYGLSLTAHLYNASAAKNGGKAQTVYANKSKTDCSNGICLLDLERGVVETIREQPWQTDTCVGNWHYDKEARYKTPKVVIDMLVDIVSRNGNLLLNFPLPSSGMLDPQEFKIMNEIGRWMAVNGEAIYSTRPWTTFGSGPATDKDKLANPTVGQHHAEGAFNEGKRKELTAADVRYTKKGSTLYAFSMGWEGKEVVFPELSSNGGKAGSVKNVALLGFDDKVEWAQTPEGLKVQLPKEKPSSYAIAFRIDAA
jgi:alpha-L-fucosidase